MRTITKEEYLQGLRAAGVEDQPGAPPPNAENTPAAAPAQEATPPVDPTQAAGDPGESVPAAGAVETAPAAGAPSEGAPAPAPAGPAHGEPFAGFNQLDKATQDALTARFAEADRQLNETRRLAEERENTLRQRERELHQATSRLAPTQQAAARLQREHEQMQARLRQFEAARPKSGLTPQLKARLDSMRQQYPEDAALFDTAFGEAEAARVAAEEAAKTLQTLQQQTYLTEQKRLVSDEHPGWEKMVRTAEFQGWMGSLDPREQSLMANLYNSPKAEDASYVLTRYRSDTTFNDPAFAVWLNALDQASRDSVTNTRRQNPMQVIGWFERDMAQASVLARTSASVPTGSAPPVSTPAHAAPPTPTPAPDLDPTRRTTASSASSTTGQPMSDRKREYIAAAEWLDSQRKAAGR